METTAKIIPFNKGDECHELINSNEFQMVICLDHPVVVMHLNRMWRLDTLFINLDSEEPKICDAPFRKTE